MPVSTRRRAGSATRTVHGSRRAAVRALDDLAAEVDNARSHAGTVTDLLERWFAAADLDQGVIASTRALVVASSDDLDREAEAPADLAHQREQLRVVERA